MAKVFFSILGTMAAAGVALGGTTLTYDSLLQSSEGWELSVGRSGRNKIGRAHV